MAEKRSVSITSARISWFADLYLQPDIVDMHLKEVVAD